jgi:predicted RNase H-like nuclease
MNFIGVDLAWGPVKRSGIAVLDADGVLVYVGAALTDDDILDTVTHYVEQGQSVVAIDAPLVVTNPTGMRLAEKAIIRDFGAFHAGAYPAALDKFPDPRGTRLVNAMHLDVDPRSTGPRRAIEVYPHPATVALFRLGRTFKYNCKKGTTVESRRLEFLRFMDAIESLATSSISMQVTSNDDWNRLRQNVEQAQRPVDLDRAEDPVDAVMCAYIALYAHRRPDDVTIYGDFPANGYILTPTLPPGLIPTPWQPVTAVAAVASSPITTAIPSSPPLSPVIVAERERCTGQLTMIQAVWAGIDTHVRELGSISTGEATEAVVDSLTNVCDILERAEQELSAIRHQLARQP